MKHCPQANFFRSLLLTIVVASIACDAAHEHEHSGEPRAFTIRFAARAATQALACGTPLVGLGSNATTADLKDFRFYVSNVRLIAESGAEVPFTLDDRVGWQAEGVGLLDFEDGSGPCSEEGSAETNAELTGSAPDQHYHGLRFDLGLPFALNHADPALQPAPLNVPAMGWFWQVGHKFLKLDLGTPNSAMWVVHLGSTECASADPALPPDAACARPALPSVELHDFDLEEQTVIADVAALLANANVEADTPMSPPGCMSFDVDADECTPVFEALGLNWDTAACDEACAAQTLFRGE